MGQNCSIMMFGNVMRLLWSEFYHIYLIWQLCTNLDFQFSRIAVLYGEWNKSTATQNLNYFQKYRKENCVPLGFLGGFFSEYRYFYLILKSMYFQKVFTKKKYKISMLISLHNKTTSSACFPASGKGGLAFFLSNWAPGITIRQVNPLTNVNAKIAEVAKVWKDMLR